MKSIFKDRFLRPIAILLIFSQGLLLSLAANYFLSSRFREVIENPRGSYFEFQINHVAEDKSQELIAFLDSSAREKGYFFERNDYLTTGNGEYKGIEVEILGDYKENSQAFDRYFFKEKIWKSEDIERLLASKDSEKKYLGFGTGSVNSLGDTLNFRFSDKLKVTKMSQSLEDRKLINGTYRVYGLDPKDEEAFLENLKDELALSPKAFEKRKTGVYVDDTFQKNMIRILLIANSIFLGLVFLYANIRSIPLVGRLSLLGRSKGEMFREIYSYAFWMGIFLLPFFICFGLYLTEFSLKNLTYLSFLCLLALLNLIILALIGFLAFIPILVIKPVDGIFNRLPRRFFIFSSSIVYLLLCAATVYLGCYLDGPYREIKTYQEVKNSRDELADLEILNQISHGEDADSYTRNSKKLFQDTYNRYKSIQDEEGVYLVNTAFYDRETLEVLDEAYDKDSIPKKPFRYFVASPSLLKAQGFDISEEIEKKVKDGERVYLLSKTFTEEERKALKNFFIATDKVEGNEDDIRTGFTQNQVQDFYDYQMPKTFTRNVKEGQDSFSKDLAILVVDANNMTFVEDESLVASGLENGYVKLSKEAKEKYCSKAYLSKFDLDDNNMTYLPISRYIDGLQRDLSQTIRVFGLFLAIAVLTSLLMVSALVIIYQSLYREEIYVRMFLGEGNFKNYLAINLLVIVTVLVSLGVCLYEESKLGLFLLGISGLFQIGVLNISIKKNDFSKLLAYLKSE